MKTKIIPAVAAVICLAACQVNQKPATRTPVIHPDPHELHVMDIAWTDGPWPLTVPEGVLRCRNMAVTFTTLDGTTYAVNGTARTKYPGLEPIWKPHPEVSGARMDIGPLLNKGLTLCNK
ncbi:DUF2511 domain-containing protein [Mycobacteroides abscessus]|nr:DUF2511 domain-containing protein [Mycobacteroides abscessus]MDM2425885.1 DUF2511 domain-containing protein [Mycobacteroides abscessus]MDM2431516.1 DUF2511 domain-containing protein [Mycobacteroides abscessus]MDM2436198.1 DUF2511 domain-containing protein [Mycobacteroides abscessus]MDM2440508.1 DUF2511 domain-containing protein [Mycobacteroides abscessus]